jgi:hypothetical protein
MGVASAESEGVGAGEREEICVNAQMVLGRNFLGRRDSVREFYFLSLFFLFVFKKEKENRTTV